MKKLIPLALIVIIGIAIAFYFLGREKSQYTEMVDDILEAINENGHLLPDEDSFTVRYDSQGDISFKTKEGYNEFYGSHTYTIREGEQDDDFDKRHHIVEDYQLTDDIKGVITEDEVGRTHSFFQTNMAEDEHGLYITNGRDKSLDETKAYLDKFEPGSERDWSYKDLNDEMTIDLNDIKLLDIKDENYEKVILGLVVQDLLGFMTAEYHGLEVNGEKYIVMISYDANGYPMEEEATYETKGGKTVYDFLGGHGQYLWIDDDIYYVLAYVPMGHNQALSEEDILELIDQVKLPIY